MLRRTLIAASRSEALRRLATDVPVTRRVARRFVAGETLDDALRVATDLNARGRTVTLDYLGEAVHDASVARAAADVYLSALEQIDAAGLACSVSVKLTQVGLHVSPALCQSLVASICERAAAMGEHVTIDMEDSSHTQATIDLLRALVADGHDNVGCALQTYLHRTLDDVHALTELGVSVRLCKGAYAEPEEIAAQDHDEIDATFVRAAGHVLRSGVYGRFATHDHRIIRQIRNLARRHQVGADAYEFQMLHGIRTPLQQEIVDAGHRLRIYLPFGDEWYPYFTRRLAERPANLFFFLRALIGRSEATTS